MSTLTKICVVVLVVLVLFSATVFTQQAVVVTNWKKAYQAEVERRRLAEAEAANNQLTATVWQRLYERQRQRAEANAQNLQSTIDQQKGEISRLSSIAADLSGRYQDLNANLKALEISLASEVRLNKELSAQLRAQRDKNIAQANELRDAQQRNSELVARNEELEREARLLRQQAAQRKLEVAQLEEKIRKLEAGGAKPVEAPIPAGPKIEATVTAVENNVVGLNVGAASGVKKGMRFYIYRGEEFVAYVRVEEVLASSCAGIIEDPRLEVQQGDKATTSLE